MLAATWLVDGWESDALVELAGLTRHEARIDARRLLPVVLGSLGFDLLRPEAPPTAAARYSAQVTWAVTAMDGNFVPYSAAEKVLEMVDDEPHTFNSMLGVDALAAALTAHKLADLGNRDATERNLRRLLLDIAEQLRVDRSMPVVAGQQVSGADPADDTDA